MRTKDDEKKEALFKATVKLVNKIGFASSSVSKIAKEAGVSPATLYVYHENKEDLLVSTYIAIKRKISDAISKNFDNNLPLRDLWKNMCFNIFEYVSNNLDNYKYTEQFSNSPYFSLVDHEELEQYFGPILDLIQHGIEQKIIKNVDAKFIATFAFYPITRLANPNLCHGFNFKREDFETAFTMAWDAIKL